MTTNPQLQPLSASQISTFIGCNRRWGFEYLEGKRPPPHPSAALGSEIHRQLEEWLKNKVMPTHSAAVPGIQHAPPPGIGVVEEKISFATPNSLWRGAIDLHYDLEQGKSWLFRAPFTTGHTIVHDWKSSGNARYNKTAEPLEGNWEKDEEERARAGRAGRLLADVQSNLYAFWAFGKGAQTVEGSWVYLSTKGQPKAAPVRVKFDKQAVGYVVGKIDLVAKEAQTLYQIRPKSSELARNPASCEKYGGCPHRAYCFPEISEGVSMSNDNSDFMAFINSRAPAVVPAIPSAPVAPPPPVPSLPMTPPAPPVAPSLPEMDEDDKNVLSYLTDVLKKNPEEALRLVLSSKTSVPSVPVAPALPGTPEPRYSSDPEQEKLLTKLASPSVPKPEAGFINPPEAANVTVLAEPPVVPELVAPKANKTEAAPTRDILDDMDRDQLKPIGVFLRVMDNSNRFGEPKIRQLIRSVPDWQIKIQDMGKNAAPVTVPETVQSEFEEKMRQTFVEPVKLAAEPPKFDKEVLAEALVALSPEDQGALEQHAEDEKEPATIADALKQMVGNEPVPVRRGRDFMSDAIVDSVREVVREEIRAALKEFFSKLGG